MNPNVFGCHGTVQWPPQSSAVFVFASLLPGLMEQSGVKIEPLPKEVKVFLLTTAQAPYCGKLGERHVAQWWPRWGVKDWGKEIIGGVGGAAATGLRS